MQGAQVGEFWSRFFLFLVGLNVAVFLLVSLLVAGFALTTVSLGWPLASSTAGRLLIPGAQAKETFDATVERLKAKGLA